MEEDILEEGSRAIEPLIKLPGDRKKTPKRSFNVKAEDFVLYEAIIKPKFDE